jgi:hypothetical protein
MVPEIVLIRNDTNEEFIVSSKDFATLRFQVGEEKPYRRKPEDPTTLDERFLQNFRKTIDQEPSKWQATLWPNFRRALENETNAQTTSIITGRRNSREVLYQALEILRARGFIKHLPRLEMLFPVGNRTLFEQNVDTSVIKTRVMKDLLERLNEMPLEPNVEFHTWNFSDDDPENFRAAREFLATQKQLRMWPRVRISVTFTGF